MMWLTSSRLTSNMSPSIMTSSSSLMIKFRILLLSSQRCCLKYPPDVADLVQTDLQHVSLHHDVLQLTDDLGAQVDDDTWVRGHGSLPRTCLTLTVTGLLCLSLISILVSVNTKFSKSCGQLWSAQHSSGLVLPGHSSLGQTLESFSLRKTNCQLLEGHQQTENSLQPRPPASQASRTQELDVSQGSRFVLLMSSNPGQRN